MDRILIILKKENGPRASSAPALGLNTIIFKYVYWYMKQISGERLQDHWSSGFNVYFIELNDLNDGLFSHIARETLNNLTQRYNEEIEKQMLAAKQDLENKLAEAEKVYYILLKITLFCWQGL